MIWNRIHRLNALASAIASLALLIIAAVSPAHARQCGPVETQKLLADDGAFNDLFGADVAMSGDTAIVGAPWDDDLGSKSGAAYIFNWNGVSWEQTQKLLQPDGEELDLFGHSIALSGDVALIGAPFDDDMAWDSGAVFIFRHDGSAWTFESKLTLADGFEGDQFGYAGMAIHNDVAVIGRPRDSEHGHFSGAVYVYRYDGSEWTQEAKLTASDADADDGFGGRVDLSNDVILIGALGDEPWGEESGSAYVFRFRNGSWEQEQKLVAPDGSPIDLFGDDVGVDGDVAIVGMYGDDDNGNAAGAAYLFRYDGVAWNMHQKLLASDGNQLDDFGHAISIRGSTAIIGAPGDDENGERSGSAYVFREGSNGDWIEVAKLTASDAAEYDGFAREVSIAGDRAILGAEENDDLGMNSGSAYIFDLNCGPTLRVIGRCPGSMSFVVEGATAFEPVAFLYARGQGSFEIPPGNPCAGAVLGLNRSVQLGDVVRADGDGVATLEVSNVPSAACGGIYVQAVDLETCAITSVAPVE